MAAMRRAEAHQIFAGQRRDIEVRQLLAFEAIADPISIAVLADDEAVAVARAPTDWTA